MTELSPEVHKALEEIVTEQGKYRRKRRIPNSVITSITLSLDLYNFLAELADKWNTPFSKLIRYALLRLKRDYENGKVTQLDFVQEVHTPI